VRERCMPSLNLLLLCMRERKLLFCGAECITGTGGGDGGGSQKRNSTISVDVKTV